MLNFLIPVVGIATAIPLLQSGNGFASVVGLGILIALIRWAFLPSKV